MKNTLIDENNLFVRFENGAPQASRADMNRLKARHVSDRTQFAKGLQDEDEDLRALARRKVDRQDARLKLIDDYIDNNF